MVFRIPLIFLRLHSPYLDSKRYASSFWSRGNLVGTAIGYRLNYPGFESWREWGILWSPKPTIHALLPIKPSIQGLLVQSRRESEVNHPLPPNAEVRNEWSCTCTPHACLLVAGRKIFTFFVDFLSVPCDFIVSDAFSSFSSWLTSRRCVYCSVRC
jgi:hypothetical protein